ncbi:hypothetical protein, partial [Streptomyces mirabilis]
MGRPAEPEALGSAAAANRFAREYGVVHSPARASGWARNLRSPTDCRQRPERPCGAVRESVGEGDGDGRGLLQSLAAGAVLLGHPAITWAAVPLVAVRFIIA